MTAASSPSGLLDRLLAERSAPGADRAAVDARIHDAFVRPWCVAFTDMSSFTERTAAEGVVHAVSLLFEYRRLSEPLVRAQGGIVLKHIGDSSLLLFEHPSDALASLTRIRGVLAEHDRDRPPSQRISVGIGAGYGPILRLGDEDVFGDEVNRAAKLGEDMARPGEVLVTQAFVDALPARDGVTFEPYPCGRFPAFRWV